MRNRFLNLDYFNSHTSTLDFPRLPDPHIDSPPNSLNVEDFLHFDSNLSVSSDLESLPIENALSNFLSDVLPQQIDISERDFDFLCRGDGEHQQFGSEASDTRFAKNECSGFDDELDEDKHRTLTTSIKDNDKQVERQKADSGTRQPRITKAFNDEEKNQGSFKVIQFETPELDFFSEEPCYALKEQEKQIFFDVPEIEIPLDMHDENMGNTIPYPCTVSESVYSVQEIAMEYIMDQKSSYYAEDDSLVQEKICFPPINYPLLEVNETSLECCRGPSTTDELDLLLEKIEYQHWVLKDTVMAGGQELLGSSDIDLLECLSDHSPVKKCIDTEPMCITLMLEVDFVSLKETALLQGNATIHPETLDFYFPVTDMVQFDEFQILDWDSFPSFEVLFGSQTARELEMCDQLFGDDINSIGNFYQSIVSHELTLVDDTFNSLPIPVLADDMKIQSVSVVVEEILAQLKPHPPSASDMIYLDWHLLQEDRCDRDICSSYWNMFEDIDTYVIGTELKSVNHEMVIIDFVLGFETSDVLGKVESKEVLDEPLTDVSPSSSLKNGQLFPRMKAEMAPKLFKSLSQFSAQDFFLNRKKTTTDRDSELPVKDTVPAEAKLPDLTTNNATGACVSAKMIPQKRDTEVLRVQLSDSILSLINNFQKIYMQILQSDTDLSKTYSSSQALDSFELLSLPKKKLMDWVMNTSAQNIGLDHKDEISMTIVALYAIKQMAYYLCFYGIHATHLYVENVFRILKYLRFKLSFLQSLIEDAHRKADNDITAYHPSLSAFQKILRSNVSQSGSKVLIVADKVFWWPLKRLLTSLRISFDGLADSQTHQTQEHACANLTLDDFLRSDCLLISYEQVSASFPLDKFSIVLEYGGSYGSSRLSNISQKLVAFPQLYFVKVELEDCSVPKALCAGVDISQSELENVSQSTSILPEDILDIGKLLKSVPVKEKDRNLESLKPVATVESHSVPVPVSTVPSATESMQIQSRPDSTPDIIIITNSQNCDKDMLISRRSSYQKILAMEKGGAQVVERELNLPVDLIFSAAMCVVWYDQNNIRKKSASTDEASSSVPLCIESIATNILMSLSFAFSICILVFEGESRFLATVMESSDVLYAAAASLGVDLQIFFSHSSELTDEIILNCIDHATKLDRHLYPKMLESETLAESFLTKFPSINPLSAHAILSSGEILADFLESSHDRRIQAIGKYHIPNESVALFSALCRYGEQEESKSGTTECSSVSSASDPGNCSSRIQSQRKRQKCITGSQTIDLAVDDYILHEPLNQSTEGNKKASSLSNETQPNQSRMFSESRDTLNEVPAFDFSLNDRLLHRKRSLTVINNLARNDVNRSKNVSNGEVIDLDDNDLFGADFCVAENSPIGKLEKGKSVAYGKSLSARRLSGTDKYHDFPSSEEIDLGIWSYSMDQNRNSEDIFEHIDSDKEDKLPLKTQGELLMEKTIQRSKSSSPRRLSGEYVTSPFGTMPISKVIHSSGLQKGSPWTTEFLNKVKEKSRMHQESLQTNNAATLYGLSNKMENIAKRKSPSTLNSYRYQGGSNSKRIIKRKWQKQFIPPPSASRNAKASASLAQTWTPSDKRATQTLSFARNGNEAQSKLVWIDDGLNNLRKRLRN